MFQGVVKKMKSCDGQAGQIANRVKFMFMPVNATPPN